MVHEAKNKGNYQNGGIISNGRSYHSVPQQEFDDKPDLMRKSWKTNSSLIYSIWKSFGLFYSLIAIYEVFNITLTFIRPTLLE